MSSATHAGFGNDSWQTPRNARTLRAYMALRNQEIAGRIRELRGSRPQTVISEGIGVAERTYQNWEAGDAKPSYRSLQKLAEFHGVGEDFILTGTAAPTDDRGAGGPTPDLHAATQLDRIEAKLDELLRRPPASEEAGDDDLDHLPPGLVDPALEPPAEQPIEQTRRRTGSARGSQRRTA